MRPRIPLWPSRATSGLLNNSIARGGQSICFFCSLSRLTRPAPSRHPKRKALNARRLESTLATPTTSVKPDARKELEDALVDLQKYAANYVNLSRIQLALNGLRQEPGTESIRVAILGLTNGSESGKTAKEVLKLLLADPLKSEEEWEREVDGHDLARPMIVRVGAEQQQEPGTIAMTRGSLLHEVNVSSATLNGHKLELLLMEANPDVLAQVGGTVEGFEESILVPTVDIPTSSTGRYSPITTPVHKALIVADGIMGAASVVSLPVVESEGVIATAVNLPECKVANTSALSFTPVDLGVASVGLGLIRKDLREAMEYEHLWFQSNVPKLNEWLKTDILTTSEKTTKPPVRRLIASLLQNALSTIAREEARQLSSSLSNMTSTSPAGHLNAALADWAESAHTELQEQLDLAFEGRRWRKLGWWKLFWRVDDVGMLSSDILNQYFLPVAERSAIFLAGRMEESGASPASSVDYINVVLNQAADGNLEPTGSGLGLPKKTLSPWPTNIPAARAHLQNESIPALQALAQKLVLQTLSTSGLTTSLGALVYFGTLTTSIYEAGAVAALGMVWSLRRMQKEWEAAREFWEGEVREEGRKAVRGVELTIRQVLKQDKTGTGDAREGDKEVQKARELVEKAAEALERLK